jgi:hypothetical protein
MCADKDRWPLLLTHGAGMPCLLAVSSVALLTPSADITSLQLQVHLNDSPHERGLPAGEFSLSNALRGTSQQYWLPCLRALPLACSQ